MANLQMGSPAKKALLNAFHRSTAERCRCEWIIMNFGGIFQIEGHTLNSNIFSSSCSTFTSGSMWRLKVNPKLSENGKEFTAFYIERCASDSQLCPEVTADIRFGISSTDGEVNFKQRIIQTFREGDVKEIDGRLIGRKDLLSNKSRFLPRDTLTVHCEVDVYSVQCREFFNDIYLNSPPELKELSNDMKRFVLSRPKTDITVKINGIEIQCHKAILSSRSSVLTTLIEKCNGDLIEIKDISPEIVEILFSYIYTGNLAPLFTNGLYLLSDLYEVAKTYQFIDLESFLQPEFFSFRSDVPACRYKFEWKIENFSKCRECSDIEFDGPTSRWFSLNGAEWQISLSMKNIPDTKDSSVRVNLLRKTTQDCFHQVQFEVVVLDVEGNSVFVHSIEHMFLRDEQCGINIYTREEIIQNSQVYLRNDALVLVCSFIVSSVNVEDSLELSGFSIVCDLVDMEDSDFRCLSHDFEKLFLQDKFQDMTIKAKDGEFRVHKCIIDARCRTLTSYEIVERKLAEMPAAIVKSFLKFLYTGDRKYLEAHALQFYFLARDLNLNELREQYFSRLEWILETSNVFTIINEAHRVGDSRLKSMALNFISSAPDEVLRTEYFRDLETENPALSKEIILFIASKVQ